MPSFCTRRTPYVATGPLGPAGPGSWVVVGRLGSCTNRLIHAHRAPARPEGTPGDERARPAGGRRGTRGRPVPRARKIRELRIPFRGTDLVGPTISAGVAAFPDHGAAADTLVRRADQALYRAKQTGRDRIVTATVDPA
jgi:GGDEF domain-containing protein